LGNWYYVRRWLNEFTTALGEPFLDRFEQVLEENR